MNKNNLIASLALKPHPEGGYFRRTFTSDHLCTTNNSHQRPAMSSIYYLLTDDSPVGHWHRNRSDIMHYFHLGSALRYWLISPEGKLTGVTLGPGLATGQQLQLLVPGGYWKASELAAGEFGLLSEAVCPGFVPQDMEMASAVRLAAEFPQHHAIIQRLAYRQRTPPEENQT
jgi:predicted cupin superfamily sugar epimerase